MMKQIFLLIAGLLIGAPAIACSCRTGIPIEQRFDRAAFVVSAIVTEVDEIAVPDFLRGSDLLRRKSWHFASRLVQGSIQVTSSLKGNAESLHSIYTHPHSSTCGLPLVRGREYLFFVGEGRLVGLCGGNVRRGSSGWPDAMARVRRYSEETTRSTPSLAIEAAAEE